MAKPDKFTPDGRDGQRPSLILTLLIGLATWIFIGWMLVSGFRRVTALFQDASAPTVATATTAPSEPESEPADLGQILTSYEEVDYTALQKGDILYSGSVSSLVLLGTPDFTDVNQVEADHIITFGVWEALKNPAFSEGITPSGERVYVSAEAVERAAEQVLGYTKALEHHSVTSAGDFRFDVITQRYAVPSYGIDTGGYAVVKSSSTQGQQVTLVLQCMMFNDGLDYELNEPDRSWIMTVLIDCSGEVALIRTLQTTEDG